MELSVSSPTTHPRVGKPQVDDKARKSRITNGRDLLPNIDGRSVFARRYRDIASALLVDQGGEDCCSESRKQLIRRFAATAVLAEQLESRLANGEQIDIGDHATLSSTLVRLAHRIGIDRVPRDVSPADDFLLSSQVSHGEEVDDDRSARDARALATYLRMIQGDDTQTNGRSPKSSRPAPNRG